MKGTSSLTSWGVRSEAGSTPHDFAETMRRRSSSIRSSVRATSMPPQRIITPSSSYWRMESRVSFVISREWSTGKMKFDACPVEPPGFGSGPLSSSTRSVQPSSARWYARLLPTMPAPTTTAPARAGRDVGSGAASVMDADISRREQRVTHRALELVDVAPHQLRGALGLAGHDRLEQLAVLDYRRVQLPRLVHGRDPDPERERVVLLERLLEKAVVAPAGG